MQIGPYKARMHTSWVGSYELSSWIDPCEARMHTSWVGSYELSSWIDPYKTRRLLVQVAGRSSYRTRSSYWYTHSAPLRLGPACSPLVC